MDVARNWRGELKSQIATAWEREEELLLSVVPQEIQTLTLEKQTKVSLRRATAGKEWNVQYQHLKSVKTGGSLQWIRRGNKWLILNISVGYSCDHISLPWHKVQLLSLSLTSWPVLVKTYFCSLYAISAHVVIIQIKASMTDIGEKYCCLIWIGFGLNNILKDWALSEVELTVVYIKRKGRRYG